MAVQDKFADEMLTDEQLDGVAGGYWLPNTLNRCYYEAAGIIIVDNFWSRDEFWYKGEDIGHYKATAVGLYFNRNNELPKSVDDAVKWLENDYKPPEKHFGRAAGAK